MKQLISLAMVCCGLLMGCESRLDTQRFKIEQLDRHLSTVSPLSEIGGVQENVAATTAAADSIHGTDSGAEKQSEKLSGIVALLKVGTPISIDLAQVRKATLENNLGLQSALIGPEIATEQLRAEQAKFQSTFTASVQQERTISPEWESTAVFTPGVQNELSVVPGLTVPLRTGGTVSLDWTVASSEFETLELGYGSYDAVTSSSQPSISLSQPLLQGAGFDYNEASIVIAQASLGSQQGQAQLAVISQLVDAETGYWNLYLAWRELQINVELYDTSRNLLDEQRELVNRGSGSIANVYNFEVSLAQSVDQVLIAERGLRLAVRSLKLLMQSPDMSLDGSVTIRPVSSPRLIAYEFNPERLVEYALSNRADLLQLEYTQIQAAVDVMVKDNLVLPQLDLQGSYTFNGFTANSSVQDASRDLFRGAEQGGWMVGATASIPIGNEIALSNYRASLLERLQAIANVRNREITVTSDVLNAIDTCETRWEQILSSRFQQQAAKRFFDAYKTLFDRGQIPSSNLTQALETLTTSQIQAASAEVNYQIALAQLAQSAGCLLGHAGVEWGPFLDKDRLMNPSDSPARGVPDAFLNTLGEGSKDVETLDTGTASGGKPVDMVPK
jgi:outer membrane protein